ncbi:MAG: hypothetical protein ACFCU3_03820 [Verrucomicrobiales bacterium]
MRSRPFTFSIVALLFCVSLATSPHSQATSAWGDILTQAEAAFAQGDLGTARELVTLVLAEEPGNSRARALLTRMELQARGGDGRRLEQSLQALILPSINVAEASLPDVLNFLSAEVQRVSGGQVQANIVLNLPNETPGDLKVTLSLDNVPVLDVLRYLLSQVGLQYRVESYAVVVFRG